MVHEKRVSGLGSDGTWDISGARVLFLPRTSAITHFRLLLLFLTFFSLIFSYLISNQD